MTDLLSENDIMHLRLQEALDAKFFTEDELKYLGIRDGMHFYLVEGKHEIFAHEFLEVEENGV
jgi:hypothetical protein